MVDNYIRAVVPDSVSAAAIWPALQIDSILIDGDHSYLGALKDFGCKIHWGTARPHYLSMEAVLDYISASMH